jgi:hypothetical protein
MMIESYGANIAFAVLAIQALVCLYAFSFYVSWMASNAVLGPGMRLAKENGYAMVVTGGSKLFGDFANYCNEATHKIWNYLDVNVCMGESMKTVAEDFGQLQLEMPGKIKQLKNGRKYY